MNLHYEQYHCEKANAPWVILIHGLFGNLDNLAAMRRHLVESFNIFAIDLPDHGQSPRLEHFNLPACVDAIKSLIDEHKLDGIQIVGHSLGGKVAMLTALTYPALISGIVVLDIAPVNYPPHHEAVFEGLNAVDLNSISGRKEADKAMAEFIEMPGVRQFLLKSLYQTENGNWQWRFNLAGLQSNYGNISIFDVPDETHYDGPATFIKGGESHYITREHQSAITGYFPSAKAKIVEGVGHWLHAEKPQVVNKLVEKALLQ